MHPLESQITYLYSFESRKTWRCSDVYSWHLMLPKIYTYIFHSVIANVKSIFSLFRGEIF